MIDPMTQTIINTIKQNRISTTEVADCLGKSGNIKGVYPLNRGHFRVGQIHLTFAINNSNWETHKRLQNINSGDIVLVIPINCDDRAVFGSLVSKYILLYQQAGAIVVDGYLRDIPHLIKENYPIWYRGGTPIGCYNTNIEITSKIEDIIDSYCLVYSNGIAVCDDSGVVVITHTNINEAFLEKLKFIENQEDIWFDCIDRRKWNTFDTVCLKKYLREV
jgi:regulator of RNase E activity RraA